MNKQVGERIKTLRNNNGWTQAELADKSGFTPQTISNWESGSREPDIDTLIELSSLFKVTLDYLLSGKEQEEKIVIMSRIELTAKKDDPSLIQDLSWSTNYNKDENGKRIMDYVVQYNSKKVFEVMLNSCQNSSHFEALFDCKYFNSFPNPKLKILEYVFPFGKEIFLAKNYGIGEIRVLNEFDPAFIARSGLSLKAKEDVVEVYQNIFKYLIENIDNLDEERKEYYFGLNQDELKRNNCWSFAYPYFIDLALRNGNKKLFSQLLDKMEKALLQVNDRQEQMKLQGYNYDQIYRNTVSLFNERPLEKTYAYAFENNMFVECERINKLLEKKHSQREIDLAKLKADPKVNIRDRLSFEFTSDHILNYQRLLDSETVVVKGPSEEEDKDKYLENLLKQYKDVYNDVISKNPIYYLELAYRGVKEKNLKELYEVAVDNDYRVLETLIENGDTKELLTYLRAAFVIKSNDIEKRDTNDGFRRVSKLQFTRSFKEKFIDNENSQKMVEYFNSTPFDLLVKWYEKGALLADVEVPESVEGAIKFFDENKKQILESWAQNIENKIAHIKTRKKNEAEYKRIKDEITKEYLFDLIKNGDEEKATIKLCVRLESILKHKFHYEGDLLAMLDSFFKNQLAEVEAFKPYDDEDNNYRSDMEKYEKTLELNAKHEEWKSKLHKLRMKRNSIVHSEKTNVAFSTDDLKSCINVVEAIDKGE